MTARPPLRRGAPLPRVPMTPPVFDFLFDSESFSSPEVVDGGELLVSGKESWVELGVELETDVGVHVVEN